MKLLVTGGAGYIGSMLTAELLAQGHAVTVLDNFMFQQQSLGHLFHHRTLSLIKGDVRDSALVRTLLPQFDAIIPLAAYVGMPLCEREPVAAEAVNQTATLALLAQLSPQQLVLMPTTNSAYGSGDARNFCDESSPLNPISSYARQKVLVEERLMERANAISFRLATVFGVSPRMRLDLLVNDFTWRALTDGHIELFEAHFKRNFIHVRDVCRVFLHGLAHFDRMRGQIYNVGLSTANLSKRELCAVIQKQLPNFTYSESQTGKDPDQRNYIVSNDKVERTGFSPLYSLDEGIRELIQAYPMLHEHRARLTNV